jgi:hypothetical protein
MASKLFVLATATGCIAAAGVGSYLAVRTAPSGLAAPLAVSAPASANASDISDSSSAATVSPEARPPAPTSAKSGDRTGQPVREIPAGSAPKVSTTPATNEAQAQPAAAPEELGPEPVSVVTAPSAEAALPTAPPATAVVEAFEEVVVPRESVMGIRIETSVSTERNKVEDPVTARLTRDVAIDGRTVIPAGTQVIGHVTVVERGGRVRERARLGVKFTSLLFDDRTRLAIDTPVIFREGEAKTGESSAKIGASAVIGGILGGIVGGKRGAAIGGAAGAAGGTAVVMSGDRSEASLTAGTTLTLRLAEPLAVRVEQR